MSLHPIQWNGPPGVDASPCAIRLLRLIVLREQARPGGSDHHRSEESKTTAMKPSNLRIAVLLGLALALLSACDASIIEVRIEQPDNAASTRGSSRPVFEVLGLAPEAATATYTPTAVSTATPTWVPTPTQPPTALIPTPTQVPPGQETGVLPTPVIQPSTTVLPSPTWVPSPTPIGWTSPLSGAPPTLPPPDAPQPTPGPSPTAGVVEVLAFDVGPTRDVAAGETFVVHYEMIGYGTPAICTYDHNTWVRQCATNLPLAGALEFTMPESVFYVDVKLLHQGLLPDRAPVVRVNSVCVHQWFFDYGGGVCPNQTDLSLPATAQRFEHGLMVSETGRLHVYFDEGVYRSFWNPPSGGSAAGLEPPEGLQVPASPFVETWASRAPYGADLFNRLGWAVGPPETFQTVEQCEFSPYPFSPCYRLMADGSVIRTVGGGLATGASDIVEGAWETYAGGTP